MPADLENQVQSWDLTFKDKPGSDFVVGQTWGCKGSDRYLLDPNRGRMDLPKTKAAIRQMTGKR